MSCFGTWKLTNLRSKIALAILLGLSVPCAIGVRAQTQDAPPKQGPVPREQLRPAFALSEAFREVARAVGPSVVNIRSTQKLNAGRVSEEGDGRQESPNGEPGFPFDEEFFRRFFGDQAPEIPRGFRFGTPNMPMPRQRVGEGTGVIAREDGYIITNNHVVDGANEIHVRLNDEREYDATIIGTDPETDLAVIKINASGLTPAKIGDSSAMEVGDWVLALGSPFGLQNTVTAGIVSAKGRANMGLTTFEDFIQTDAAINPGNSGGPLANLYGEVVGITTAISTRTGQYAGVGFAIPSNMVKTVMKAIIEDGKVQRGWLGVSIRPISEEIATYAGINRDQGGAYVDDVLPDTPAQEAGLRPGDIVLKLNGQPVDGPASLMNRIASLPPGKEATLSVYRDGETQDLTVKLGERRVESLARGTQQRPGAEPAPAVERELGLSVQELTPQLAQRLGISQARGVVITGVTPDTPAAEKGIEAGDVITMVNESKVDNVNEFHEALGQVEEGAVVRLRVVRDGTSQFVFLKMERDD